MKVGIVCHPTHGGSGVVASELALELAERGHDVHVLSYAVPFRLRSDLGRVTVHEVAVTSYPLFKYPPYTLALATKLADVASHERLDVIHAHYAVPHAVSALLARQILGEASPAVVTTVHGTDITLVGSDPAFDRVVRWALEASDVVTAVSRYLAGRTASEFGLDRAPRVVYNFVTSDQCRRVVAGASRERFASRGEKVLLHASNFRAVKRVRDVVRVFARVRERVPSVLLLVGDGPERGPVAELARELGVGEKVRFLGEQDALEPYLSFSDLALLPSGEESFGLVALEAMSCEVPVVATRVGGLPEVVADGETGYLRPLGDVAALADAAIELLGDEVKRRRFAERGRSVAVERFDASVLLPRYEEVYRDALAVRDAREMRASRSTRTRSSRR